MKKLNETKDLEDSVRHINNMRALLGELAPEFGPGGSGGSGGSATSLQSTYIGKYVICRSRNEGVNSGKVLNADATGVILEDARRLFYHRPADTYLSWYEGVALTGLSDDSKVGPAVEKLVVEDYSLTPCTEVAEKSLRNAPTNAQD